MLVQQSYRYELKPNNKQKTLLAKHAGAARFAYNWGLAQRIEEYKKTGKSSNAIEQHRELNTLKKTDLSWMYEVSKCAPQEALRDLDKAFKNFWRGRKEGQKTGFPKFKKKWRNDSFRLTGSIHVIEEHVVLPRLGRIRTKECTDLKGHILSATVGRVADRWFVSFAVERRRKEYEPIENSTIGVDVGINYFAVLSDGTKMASPRPLESALRLLKRRSKQHSRKKLGSANRKKSALHLARLHRKIKNKRKDFLHKATTTLTKTKSMIVVEDLNVQGMLRNHLLSRQIVDMSWGEFIRMLNYKTKWYGSHLIKAPKFYPSSKICSRCGAVKQKFELSNRVFVCEVCGIIIDRDVNAARNLEYLSTHLKRCDDLSTVSSTGSNACGDTSGGGTQNMLWSTSNVSMKQEANTKYSSGIFG